jgi:hypothetical protein
MACSGTALALELRARTFKLIREASPLEKKRKRAAKYSVRKPLSK